MAKNTKLALTINLVIFIIIFFLHLLRIFYKWDAAIGGWVVPLWLSWIAIIISLVLVYLNYKAL